MKFAEIIANLNVFSTDFGIVESSASRQDGIRENLDFFSQCKNLIQLKNMYNLSTQMYY